MLMVIYVTFNPNIETFKNSIDSIIDQVDSILIVDNTPTKTGSLDEYISEKVDVLYLYDNKGIAYAQNIGLSKAIYRKANYVLLSDQDTVFPENYVKEMLPIFNTSSDIIAIGPTFVDRNKKSRDGFIKLNSMFFTEFFPENGHHRVMQLIASGKIIDMNKIREVGFMNEDLFIDWVDFEWCWRAIKKGYKLIGNADVIISHSLGESSKNIIIKEMNLRSPIRHYYITRNSFYLLLYSSNIDKSHKIHLLIKSFGYVFGYSFFGTPHWSNFKYVILGMYHGLIGKLGKLTVI